MSEDAMTTVHHTLSFWPSYAQFVLYDTQAEFNPDEEPLWGRPEEEEGHLSVRPTEVSVGLFADAEVQIEMDVYPVPPELPKGDWDVNVEVPLLVASGELGIRDVVQDVPEATAAVPPGWLRLRVLGRNTLGGQTFWVQVWPITSPTS
ncbi:hypothetical protein E5F05_19265 [Deinococcus metallilatus]|uniref:Uncharacterized protein n=1 Tax=Deinococcus metallilatus TaxID=1211322 RepID=A0AAJ5JY02_9DEIO|nr:hypothetical protein [Deinococcus metallilatus]MBB5296440.1 hypothetical protein [Deinococcus metallilatus]QBY09890.1 hypothetical protein E5F05_19265 [Deinococcus metallilatus]RXJ08614.1 hypothetical protein ERJ73_18105 [Deinococcus metallilatus]TLK25088.1 hypothetical protein FCS05_13020 [Deinococcus metallilatus]GMA14647.1 hypothetical protein GCM10025871_09780 [Deinococcus metallilatus]